MILLAIDPGLEFLAWATFYEKRLLSCGLSIVYKERQTLGELARSHVNNVPRLNYDYIVLEEMRHYPAKGARHIADAKANDLLRLQLIGAYVSGSLSLEQTQFISAPAMQWKGQVKKHVTKHRVYDALDEREQEVFAHDVKRIAESKRHNVFDAIGIGLFALGRIKGR